MNDPLSVPASAPEADPATRAFVLRPPRSGDACPACGQGRLDYNGLLELECPACGYRYGGEAGGCT
jgi:uncharacterized protein (DUF983 family)